MTTVDIEPASLAVTPGESQTLTLTVRNDGAEIEAYHLTVVDEAAAVVVIEPDTLLVRPGETATAAATMTLEHTGRWDQGDMIVRFHVVPAGQPDAFVVAEAIATIQSFSDVAAVLSPPALEGRRSATTEVTIANAGNARTHAEISVSAGELTLSLDQSRVALPPNGSETVGLRVRAASLRWRGEPVQHPFVVTVSPEDGQAISLSGDFTQLPLLGRRAFVAAIAVGVAAVAALLVWAGVAVLGGVSAPETASQPSATATATATPPPEPEIRMVVATSAGDAVRAGDPVEVSVEPAVGDVPRDSLLAVEVVWPEGMNLTEHECEAWVAPDADRALEGEPRSGDECVIGLTRGRNDAGLTFATDPVGFSGAVSARATRLVALDDSDVTTLETGPGSDFGATATAPVELAPYLFWLEVVDVEPTEGGPDAAVVIHHVMRGDGTDQAATMAFEIVPPAFADQVVWQEGCSPLEESICTIFYNSDAADATNTTFTVNLWFGPDTARGVGTLTVAGTSLTIAPPNDVDDWIRGDDGLVVSDHMFDVDVTLDADDVAGAGGSVTAAIDVFATAPAGTPAYPAESLELVLELAWPEGLVPIGSPVGCTLAGNLCTLAAPGAAEPARITMRFAVDDPFAAGEVRASGATLTYDPTTRADRRDGRTQPTVPLPPHWIGSNAEWFPN